MDQKPVYATIGEAAVYLGKHPRTLQRWAGQAYGPDQERTGPGRGRPRYRWDQLEKFKAELDGVPA
jgi:hypothetical protein